MARTRQNGEGSVYRRASDGMWIGSITIGWEGDRRVRKTVSTKTATGVREKLRVVQAKIDAGLPLDDDKLAVNQLLDRWFDDVMRHQVASPALSNYETIARIHIRPTLGRKQVAKLKPAEIDALLSAKLDSGLSVSTVRRIRSVLAQALMQAQRWEMVGRNAASLSRPPRAPRREGRSLSPGQVGKLVTAMTEDRLASLCSGGLMDWCSRHDTPTAVSLLTNQPGHALEIGLKARSNQVLTIGSSEISFSRHDQLIHCH